MDLWSYTLCGEFFASPNDEMSRILEIGMRNKKLKGGVQLKRM